MTTLSRTGLDELAQRIHREVDGGLVGAAAALDDLGPKLL